MIRTKSSILSNDSSKSRKGLGRLYRIPSPEQLWGEPQQEHVTNWAELFFDLIYVAVAFQEGKLLADAITNDKLQDGLFVFIVTFVSLFDGWSQRLQYSARFHSRDIFHKFLDILGMMVVAGSALHLDKLKVFTDQDTYHLFAFAVLQTFAHFKTAMHGLELMTMSPLQQVQGTGEAMMRRSLPSIILFAISIYTALPISGRSWQVTVGLWGASLVLTRIDLVVRIYFGSKLPKWLRGNIGKEHSVPMNIDYSIHRYGEWTMLMLGEGVLQLIVVSINLTTTFYIEFVLGYLLMAFLQLIHYATEPNHPDGHAMRRSGRRVVFWINFEALYSASLTVIGVGLKLVLTYSANEEQVAKYASKLLCFATGSAIFLLWLCRLCHAGLSEELFEHHGRARRGKLIIWTLKFLTPGVLFAVPYLNVTAPVLVLVNVVVVSVAFALQVKDARVFGDSLRVHHHALHSVDSQDASSRSGIEPATERWVCDDLGVPVSLHWISENQQVVREKLEKYRQLVAKLEKLIESPEDMLRRTSLGRKSTGSGSLDERQLKRRSSVFDEDKPELFQENI